MKPGTDSAPFRRSARARRLVFVGSLMTGLLGVTACGDEVICGRDTVEVEGRCVPASRCLVTCQPGTVLDETIFGCVPEFPPRVCDPDTTVEELDTNGVFVCSGAAASTCELPVPCPEPSSLQVAVICGRIVDVESQRPEIAADADTGNDCDPASPASGGPCSLQLRLFDAEALASSPGDAVALEASVTIDSCGRFAVEHTPPAGDRLAIEVDDGDSFDDRARTITTAPAIRSGSLVDGLRAFTVRSSTDARWTSDSESVTTFEESGASLALLREDDGAPAAGIAQAGALYFDEPGQRIARIDPVLGETGDNGAALAADAPAVPTRDGQICLDAPLPFAPGLIWVAEMTVSCPRP